MILFKRKNRYAVSSLSNKFKNLGLLIFFCFQDNQKNPCFSGIHDLTHFIET
jgi:hypothetical protein